MNDTSGWEESVQYTLVRNENYWGDAPYYDEIIIKFYSEESTRYSEFQAGNLDAVYLTRRPPSTAWATAMCPGPPWSSASAERLRLPDLQRR